MWQCFWLFFDTVSMGSVKCWHDNNLRSSVLWTTQAPCRGTLWTHTFAQGDSCEGKMMNKEFRSRAKPAKLEDKNKVERSLKMTVNIREAWRGPNTTIGRTQKQQRPHSDDHVQFVSELWWHCTIRQWTLMNLYNSSVNSDDPVQFVNELWWPCTIRQWTLMTLYNSSMNFDYPIQLVSEL